MEMQPIKRQDLSSFLCVSPRPERDPHMQPSNLQGKQELGLNFSQNKNLVKAQKCLQYQEDRDSDQQQ